MSIFNSNVGNGEMSDKALITGKFSRTLKTTAIATKSGIKHLGYLGAKQFADNPDELLKKHEEDIGRIVFKGLSQMRGTALKASQLLSLEQDLLPEGIRNELKKGCYRVPPINRALVRKVFIQEFGETAQECYKTFSFDAFAAASLGQVHDAVLQTDEHVAVKIQYPGIRESIDNDLKILSFILSSLSISTRYMPKKEVIDTALNEIEVCLKDEVDYLKEADNTRWFKQNMKMMNVVIPHVYDDYSSQRVLTTEFLEGKHLDEWLASGPSQGERNSVGQTIFNAFLYCAFELKALHADPHEGNYLFLNNGKVGLLDFGCIKHLSEDFPDKISQLVNAILDGDQKQVFESYQTLDIFSEGLTFDIYEKELLSVLSPLQDWMSLPFKNSVFDFSSLPVPPMNISNNHQTAVKYLHGLKRDQMYFDRTYFGVYQLLKKIGATVSTENPWVYVS